MRHVRSFIPYLAAMLLAPGIAHAKLSVVATTPEFGALATVLGGPRVSVTVLAKPTEDPHFVDARPSHVVALNHADVLIEGGAELEVGWLPPLVQGARNKKIQPGTPGWIVASEGISLIDVPATADRSRGDIHVAGNPHFMMDPENARTVARHIVATFCQLDGPGCADYKKNLAAFEASLDAKMQAWTRLLAPYKGQPIVTYHTTWRYFARRFGLTSEVFLEPKPGIPPSPPHLAEVIGKMNAEKMHVILVEPYQSSRIAASVAAHTGAIIVNVSQFPGALPGTQSDYLALMDADVKAVAAALAKR